MNKNQLEIMELKNTTKIRKIMYDFNNSLDMFKLKINTNMKEIMDKRGDNEV